MKTVTVDKNRVLGRIRELNGVGGGPLTNNFTCDATELFREARIPYSRTHDIEYPYGAGEFVDIHCVFPNSEVRVVDDDRDFEPEPLTDGILTLDGNTFALVTVEL